MLIKITFQNHGHGYDFFCLNFKTVFHHISKHGEESWKYNAQQSIFWQSLRCLEMWWNTVLSVWYIFSVETKTKE